MKMIHNKMAAADLVVEGVVQCCHHWLLMTHDPILDLRLHLQDCQQRVEREEQAIRLLIKEQLAMHWKGKKRKTLVIELVLHCFKSGQQRKTLEYSLTNLLILFLTLKSSNGTFIILKSTATDPQVSPCANQI